MTQRGFCCSQLQVQQGREVKAPAKVLIGWGRGPCDIDQMVPLNTRNSRWLPKLLSISTAVEPYTCKLDHLIDNTTVTKGLPQDSLLKRYDNQRPIPSVSSKMIMSGQDKVNFHLNREYSNSTSTPKVFLDHVQEHKSIRSQVPPEQPENLAEKLLVDTSSPGTPKPGPKSPGTGKSQRNTQDICSSHPDKQHPDVYSNNCSKVPLPAYQVTCHKQSPLQSLKEGIQISPSSAPTCQLQEAVEDQVLVFDMATGNTRMGLLCHDPMGSRAVLVGLMPTHPSSHAPENILSTQPVAKPIVPPASDHSSFWSTTAMLSSPVPSSLSSGSYREVALAPKEARLNLQSWNFPGTETATTDGVLTGGPAPPGTALQFVDGIQTHVPDPSLSKSDAEKNELSRTIWVLESSRMPDVPMVQTKKLQWMNSEPILPASTQVLPRSLLQEDAGSHNQKESITAHPDNPQAKDGGQALLSGQTFFNGQNLLVKQLSLAEQSSLTAQPPSTRQPPLTSQPSFTAQTPFARQFSFTGQSLFTGKIPINKELPLSRGTLPSGESGQPSTQEGETLGLPTHLGVLPVPLVPEETCIYVSRDKVGINSTQSSRMHGFSWQPSRCSRVQEEQLSLLTFITPGNSYQVLPMAVVGTEHQRGNQVKLTAEDITHSSMVSHFGLSHGACYELVSAMNVPPRHSPVVCCHSSGPYQDMAAVVIDTGTGFTKCGLAGEDHVLSVVPSQVQLLQHPVQGQPRYVVPENQEGSYPVLNRGVVSDWDALEVLWQHLFYCRLGVQPEELAVLVADSPISPRTNREKVAEILFEHFHVPAMQTVHQALLALYAYGRTTGLVLGSGHGTSYVAPILTGDLAPLDIYRLDVAGADLTDYLAQLLLAGGHLPPKTGLVSHIKEACCYVAMDIAAERACTQAQDRVNFMLPDKQVVTLGSERFCCPEALFQPNLLGLNQPGLPQLALLSISRLEAKQQEQLLANVVLDGGSTLLSGFPERLRQELGPGATVLGSPHRAAAAWLGGSIMACRNSFQNLWLSRQEYEEEGPWAIYKYQL
ncbi:uncharacterized protein ACOB6Z_017327 [Ctenodactylus gundi]